MPDRRQNSDHDLLIELRTEMQGVRNDIKDLKDGTQARLSVLEGDRVTQNEFKDHETRIRFIEKYVWGAIALIGFINLVGFGGFVYLITHLH